MSQFDKFPPAIQQIVSSLELRIAALKPRIAMESKLAKETAAELADIEAEWHMAGGTGGFFDWAERHSGMHRSTIHRYLNVHRAIKAGLDQKTSPGGKVTTGQQGIMELSQKGAALMMGMSPEVLKGDLSQQEVQTLIESRRHAGLVSVRVPEESVEDVDWIVDKFTENWASENDGEKIEKPEALNLAFKTLRRVLEEEE